MTCKSRRFLVSGLVWHLACLWCHSVFLCMRFSQTCCRFKKNKRWEKLNNSQFFSTCISYHRYHCVHNMPGSKENWTIICLLPVWHYLQCWLIAFFLTPPPSHIAAVVCCLFIFVSFCFLFFFCSASFAFFVPLCRLWADIILWKGNDPTVLRLCMCAAQCNGLAFYCLPHTNPTTEGMRRHLQGAVCELQPHMKEWPLKMIKEITALGCTTLLSCLARCMSLCPNTNMHWHAQIHIHTCIHGLPLISFSLWWIFSKWSSVEMSCT